MAPAVRLTLLTLSGALCGWALAGRPSSPIVDLHTVEDRDQAISGLSNNERAVSDELQLMSFPPQGEIRHHSRRRLTIFRWQMNLALPRLQVRPVPDSPPIDGEAVPNSVEEF